MAPRHGKSELLSHWTPVWYLANNPRARVGLASYAADFASTWGRKARQTVASTPGLNITVSEDRALASDWELCPRRRHDDGRRRRPVHRARLSTC